VTCVDCETPGVPLGAPRVSSVKHSREELAVFVYVVAQGSLAGGTIASRTGGWTSRGWPAKTMVEREQPRQSYVAQGGPRERRT